jgi:hypothetical protein
MNICWNLRAFGDQDRHRASIGDLVDAFRSLPEDLGEISGEIVRCAAQ